LDIEAVLLGGVGLQKTQINAVKEIAKKFGGGGHRESSGFPLSSILGNDLLDLVVQKMGEIK
jgi:nanoRNase/pAp phosphatase (c-di-AMP/oligoRNAs hydrolase)